MHEEEGERPQDIEDQLNPEPDERGLALAFIARSTPDEPGRDRHHDKEDGPYDRKDAVRWREVGLRKRRAYQSRLGVVSALPITEAANEAASARPSPISERLEVTGSTAALIARADAAR